MSEDTQHKTPTIELRHVEKHFGDLHVLKDINLQVVKGEVLVLIGPSGSGKSTLCRTINRLETIDSGEILIEGKPLPQEGKELAAMRAEIGMVFTASAKGYVGDVTVMVGIGADGKVTGIEILSHDETPGLGANSTKPEFKNRFVGKSGVLMVSKTSNEGQNVQAITAATITSKAVTSAVNASLSAYAAIKGGVSE